MNTALARECTRYDLDYDRVLKVYAGTHEIGRDARRHWWDYAILIAGAGVFFYLGLNARVPALAMNYAWLWVLAVILVVSAVACARGLWKATRFS